MSFFTRQNKNDINKTITIEIGSLDIFSDHANSRGMPDKNIPSLSEI